jgi:hypothetical protein
MQPIPRTAVCVTIFVLITRTCFKTCPESGTRNLLEVAGRLEGERCRELEEDGDVNGQTPDPSQTWQNNVFGTRSGARSFGLEVGVLGVFIGWLFI